MNTCDIVLAIPLIYAAYKGFRDGIVAQLSGIIALLVGVYLAYKFAEPIGAYFSDNTALATPITFVGIVIAALLIIGFGGQALGKTFNAVGLGLINRVGGILLSLVKMTVIVSLLLICFDHVNAFTHWVKPEKINHSALYKPVQSVAPWVFPYVTLLTEKVKDSFEDTDKVDPEKDLKTTPEKVSEKIPEKNLKVDSKKGFQTPSKNAKDASKKGAKTTH